MTARQKILMCEPRYYDVDYVINPWMDGNVHQSSFEKARKQWSALHRQIEPFAEIQLIEPIKGWPDMVFTANAGLVVAQDFVLSRFAHPERQGEEPYFADWFEQAGFGVRRLPDDVPFEGAGDALLHRSERRLFAGHGFRSDVEAHRRIAEWLDLDVVSLRLVDSRFYHLDTCFCPLERGYLLYYPPAFDETSQARIEKHIPSERRIVVEEADATQFACNAVNFDDIIILNRASQALVATLASRGFRVIQTELSEFLKAGGAAKCLTLRTTELA